MIATMEPGMIGLMELLETPRIRASESRSSSRCTTLFKRSLVSSESGRGER